MIPNPNWDIIKNYSTKTFEKWWNRIEDKDRMHICKWYFFQLCHSHNKKMLIWYNPKYIKQQGQWRCVIKYCKRFLDLWEKDYLIWKLQNDLDE